MDLDRPAGHTRLAELVYSEVPTELPGPDKAAKSQPGIWSVRWRRELALEIQSQALGGFESYADHGSVREQRADSLQNCHT